MKDALKSEDPKVREDALYDMLQTSQKLSMGLYELFTSLTDSNDMGRFDHPMWKAHRAADDAVKAIRSDWCVLYKARTGSQESKEVTV